jgi:hypothetical protein
MERGYDEAIKALNSLQTNYQFLDAVLKEKQKNVHLNLPQTVADLERSGMTIDDLVMFIHNCVFLKFGVRSDKLRTVVFLKCHRSVSW